MLRKYIENDFAELLRMRCFLYPHHTKQELSDEITALFLSPA